MYSVNRITGEIISQQAEKRKQDILEIGREKKRNVEKTRNCGKDYLTEGTIERMGCCRNYWEMVADATLEKKKTIGGNSCKSPWCPVCVWLQARKDALKISILMLYILQEYQREFLFLTLTAPNVTGDRLKETITTYNKAFNNLMGRDEVKRVVKGYVRKLEVTYNKEPIITRDMWYGNKEKHIKAQEQYFRARGLKIGDTNPNYDTYHPHFHVMVAVNKSYFDDTKQYINREKWLRLWREVMGDTSITQVDARRVTLDSGKAIGEIAKYTAKDSDYTHSPEVFGVFYRALNRRQKTTYGGEFAEANDKFKKGKLNDLKEKDLTDYVYRLFYQWQPVGGEYLLADIRELTERERAEIHGIPWEEMDFEDD